MKLVLILPDKEFLEALEKGLDSGEISIDLSEALVLAKRTRKKNKRESMSFILPPNEQEIVDKWNNNEFIKSVGSGMISDARNKPVYSKDMDDVRPALRQALKCIGKDSIFGHMEKYFDCCVNHRHVWDGANHGFKNLGGFLRKLVRCEKAQQLPWWEQKEFPDQLVLVDDPYPEITKSVAECFGLEFTGSSVYAYDDKPKEHKSFATIAKIVERLDALKLLPVMGVDLLHCLMECTRETCGTSSAIFPGHLVSKTVITTAFPQYLYENLGLSNVTMDTIVSVISDVLGNE